MPDLFLVLVAEDDKNDVFLLKRSLRNAGVVHPVYIANDGQEAMDYLSGASQFADRERYPLPGLVILDIKMPKKTGLEVLKWVRRNSALKHLPVVITSSSTLQVDMDEAETLGANAYLVKPLSIPELLRFFQADSFSL